MFWQLLAFPLWVRMSDQGICRLLPILNSSWYQKGLKGSVLICKDLLEAKEDKQSSSMPQVCKFNPQVHRFFDPCGVEDCFVSPWTPCNKKRLINEERPPLHVKKTAVGNHKMARFHGWICQIFIHLFFLNWEFSFYWKQSWGLWQRQWGEVILFLLEKVRNTDVFWLCSTRGLGVNLFMLHERQYRGSYSSCYNFEASVNMIEKDMHLVPAC